MGAAILTDLQTALKRVIYERGRIDPADIEIAFEAPIRSWVGARTGPTIDLFLYDIQENTDLRKGGMESGRANGRGQLRMPPRRFDLTYLVSVLSTEVTDEHLVLWRLLLTMLKHPILPEELLPESLKQADVPITCKLELPDGAPKPVEIWSALEQPPRPSIGLVVTVPADLEIAFDAPLVLTRTARYRQTRLESAEPQDRRNHIAGVVRGRGGDPVAGARVALGGTTNTAVTNAEGAFFFWSVPDGSITLHVTHDARSRTVSFALPSESYQIVLE
jgi:hypothetical protein